MMQETLIKTLLSRDPGSKRDVQFIYNRINKFSKMLYAGDNPDMESEFAFQSELIKEDMDMINTTMDDIYFFQYRIDEVNEINPDGLSDYELEEYMEDRKFAECYLSDLCSWGKTLQDDALKLMVFAKEGSKLLHRYVAKHGETPGALEYKDTIYEATEKVGEDIMECLDIVRLYKYR